MVFSPVCVGFGARLSWEGQGSLLARRHAGWDFNREHRLHVDRPTVRDGNVHGGRPLVRGRFLHRNA
eukprot:5852049-Prymnesium_polylepis.1